MKRWASVYAALTLALALGLFLAGPSSADVTVTPLVEGFETSVPPADWGYGSCNGNLNVNNPCVTSANEFWDKRSVSEYPSGIVPHTGSGMARFNAYEASLPWSGFIGWDELGYEGAGPTPIQIPLFAQLPLLKFWKYNQCANVADTAKELNVGVAISGGGSVFWSSVYGNPIDRCDLSKPQNQWVEYVIDLSNTNPVNLGFDFRGFSIYPIFQGLKDGSATAHRDILIDDVRIEWQCAGDALSVSSPATPAAVATLPYTGTVTISGGRGDGNYTLISWTHISGPGGGGWISNVTQAAPGSKTINITSALGPGTTNIGDHVIRLTVTDDCQVNKFDVTVTVQPYDCASYPDMTLTPASGALAVGNVGVPGYSQPFTIGSTKPGATQWLIEPQVANTLPPGLTLPGMGVGTTKNLTGTPSYPGIYDFYLMVSDDKGCQSGPFGPYYLEVDGACPAPIGQITPVGTPFVLPAAQEMHSYSFGGIWLNLNAGTPDPTARPYTFDISAGSLPPGMTISVNPDGRSATIAGTPPDGSAGTYNFTVRATDQLGSCSVTGDFRIVVNNFDCNPSMIISPADLPQGTVGTPYSQTLTMPGAPTPITFAVTNGSLPPGLSLSAGGLLSGTPTAAGTYNFEVTATDSLGCQGVKQYALSVGCPAISVDPAAMPSGTVGTPYSQTISATGGNPPYSFNMISGALPNGLSFAAPVISGTPTAAETRDFTVRVTDSLGCQVDKPYSLTVNCPNITLTPTTLPNGTVGTAYDQTLGAAGGTAPYSFSLTAGQLPTGLNLLGTGRILGTPTDDGAFSFTIRATDAYGCTGEAGYDVSIGCLTISISPTSLPNGTVGTSYTATLTVTGGTAPHTFAVSSGSLPDGLDLLSDGTITGVPVASGTFNFTVVVTDSLGCTSSRAYTVVISCPTISLSPASLPAGSTGHAYSQTITASGGTAPYTFQVTSGNLPAGLSLAANGTLSGTPAVTSVGSYSFTVRATDANGCSGTKNYTLQINPGWAPVSISSITKVAGTGFKLDINGSGFQPGVVVKIGSQVWPTVDYKSSSQLRLKGTGLRALFPKGVPVTVTVTNPDGGTASYTYTRGRG